MKFKVSARYVGNIEFLRLEFFNLSKRNNIDDYVCEKRESCQVQYSMLLPIYQYVFSHEVSSRLIKCMSIVGESTTLSTLKFVIYNTLNIILYLMVGMYCVK